MSKKGKSKRKVKALHQQKVNKRRKIVADQKEDVIGNNAEKVTTPEEMAYIEDTQKPDVTETTCCICGEPNVDGKEHEECMDREAMLVDVERRTPNEPPAESFDPKKLIADALKKHGT